MTNAFRRVCCMAAKIGKKLSGGDGKSFELKVFSYQPRSHTSVEHDFSTARRIVEDKKLSLKVAEALDKEFRRTDSTDSVTALLAESEVSYQEYLTCFLR